MFLILLWGPATMNARAEEDYGAPPAIAQTLVREGDFAVKLANAMGLGTSQDEAEAESLLAGADVAPRNGWIADYPVTPDIVDELYKSVHDAAESGAISLSVETALQRLNGVMDETGLAIKTGSAAGTIPPELPGATSYPTSTEINNYYYTEGPPVVTYYTPPSDYYYLYGWVPYPFWWSGFWFSGFFVLNDFHRIDFDHDRRRFISNHFNDVRNHRVTRVDPVTRFHEGVLTGRGVSNGGGVTSTMIPGNYRTIPNLSRTPTVPAGGNTSPAITGNRTATPARGERFINTPTGSATAIGKPTLGASGGVRPFISSYGTAGPSSHGGSRITTPGRGSSTFSGSTFRSGTSFTSHFSGGGGFSGRGRR